MVRRLKHLEGSKATALDGQRPSRMCSARSLLVLIVVASACAPRYAYEPTANATSTIQGRAAADYPIPPDAPKGDVRIASYGLTDVSPKSTPGELLRALHLRVVVADNDVTPWTFDTREQRVDLDGRGQLTPALASANRGTPPPLVTIEPNGKRVVDLFFLLPDDMQHADQIPEFDALWRVHTGATVIAERTPFERLAIEPDYGANNDWDYGDDYYWGGPYWVNPEPYFGVGIGPGYFAGGAVIRRSPHFWRGGYWGGGTRGGGGFHGGGGHGGGGHGGGGHGGGRR
jgi:hypothetical protein